MLKLDIGSGYSKKPGYTRLDIDPDCCPDILSQADKLPIDNDVYDEVYAAHILEHFDPEETFGVLREWYRVLKVGGILVVKVPDIGWATKAVSDESISWQEYKRILFGADPKANEWMRHKNAFNAAYLQRMLFITRYTDIENRTKIGSGELVFYAKK